MKINYAQSDFGLKTVFLYSVELCFLGLSDLPDFLRSNAKHTGGKTR